MTTKNKILLDFNIIGNNKIKHLSIHPKKDWISMININNTFSLWNYKQKILIKSFSCSSLDDNKNIDIKQSLFYDKYSLSIPSNKYQMKNNIIFVTVQRIYFYDYLTDVIKLISQKQLEQKNIRKVSVYSESKICIVLNDGSFKVLDTRGLYSKDQEPQVTIRTFKGYHTKPISWIFSYSQNVNEMPRVITVSASDGLMACWNVDNMLHSGQSVLDTVTPCFKFLMVKGSKNDSNNGQQIISLQYDSSSYHILTLTESYLTIWSTMTGMEIKRVKNNLKLKQIIFFNHFSYGASSFIGHSFGTHLSIIRQLDNLQLQDQINLKQYIRETDLSIISLKSIPQYPTNIFIQTSTQLLIMQIDKFYRTVYGIHPLFLTQLTTLNCKRFLLKGQKQFRKSIQSSQIQSIQFPSDVLMNSFYLSFDSPWIYFNLIELQFKSMVHQCHVFKMHKVDNNSPLINSQSSRSRILVSYDGREIIIFNKILSYFESYQAQQKISQNLIQTDQSNSIDFYTEFKQSSNGFCRSIVWHQYKLQFAAICALDKNGKIISYLMDNQKKGLFSKSKNTNLKLSGEILTWHVCIFDKIKNNSNYKIIMTSPPLKTKIFNLFSVGSEYAFSQQQGNYEILQFISTQKGIIKDIQGSVRVPEKIYVSYCQTFQIYCYDGYFVLYKVLQNGTLSYFQSIQQSILEGYFWEKFFFYTTKTGIYFLQTLTKLIIIKIAHYNPPKDQLDLSLFEGYKQQDLEPYCYPMLQGQLQILGIINMNLLLINESNRITFLSLVQFPYIQFCFQISSGYFQKVAKLYNCSSLKIQQIMRQTLTNYGLILSDILN